MDFRDSIWGTPLSSAALRMGIRDMVTSEANGVILNDCVALSLSLDLPSQFPLSFYKAGITQTPLRVES